MIRPRAIWVSSACLAISLWTAGTLAGADLSDYRGFQFGATLSSAATVAGSTPTDATVVHARPDLIQELVWRPRAELTDPIKDGLLGFFNGKLYRMVIHYDRYKVEGLTTEDMVSALAEAYGPATEPDAEIPYRSIYGKETASVVARWEDPDYQYNLVRLDGNSGFALVLTDKSVDEVARAAIKEAVQLNLQEAPLRALEVQKQRELDEQLRIDKARTVNLQNFRP